MSWAPGTILVVIGDLFDPRDDLNLPYPKVGEYVVCRRHFSDMRATSGYGVTLMEFDADNCYDAACFRPAESDHSEAGTVRREEPVSV